MQTILTSSNLSASVSTRVLIVGDLLAFLAFVVLGRIVHASSGPADWLLNAPRIGAPFLLGWALAATFLGAYPRPLTRSPRRFLLASLAAVLVGDLIAFVLRAYAFSDPVTLPFVLTALAFSTLIVVGWRFLYIAVISTKALRAVNSQ